MLEQERLIQKYKVVRIINIKQDIYEIVTLASRIRCQFSCNHKMK